MTQGPGSLWGRQAERDTIVGAVSAVAHSRTAGVLELDGEAGIGKTTLLENVAALDLERLTLEGRAAGYERGRPFGVFIDALDGHLARLHDDHLERLGSERLRELAQVFPALESLVNDREDVVGSERVRIYRAVRSLLERLAGERALVLVLDDLHWATSRRVSSSRRCCAVHPMPRCSWSWSIAPDALRRCSQTNWRPRRPRGA